MQRLATQTMILVLLFSVLISASIIAARQQATSVRVAILHLADCVLPCWIGITPRKTTLVEAKQYLYEVYGREPGISITSDTLDTYTISGQSQGNLMEVDFLRSYLGDNAPIQQVMITPDIHRPITLSDIFRYLPPFPYVDVSGNWEIRGPTWSVQGVGPANRCYGYEAIEPSDYAVRFTLGEDNKVFEDFESKWQGFRTCYHGR